MHGYYDNYHRNSMNLAPNDNIIQGQNAFNFQNSNSKEPSLTNLNKSTNNNTSRSDLNTSRRNNTSSKSNSKSNKNYQVVINEDISLIERIEAFLNQISLNHHKVCPFCSKGNQWMIILCWWNSSDWYQKVQFPKHQRTFLHHFQEILFNTLWLLFEIKFKHKFTWHFAFDWRSWSQNQYQNISSY